MRALIYTFGTRGDIEPFVALALALRRRGHQAAICTAEGYRTMIESAGVDYLHMDDTMLQLIRDAMPQMSGPRDSYQIFRAMGPAQRAALDDQWVAAQEYQPTIVIYHPKSLGGYHVAERLGVPGVLSLALPFFTPTREFPVPFLHRSLGGAVNRWTYEFNRVTALAYGGMINQFRAQLRMPPIRRTDALLRDRAGRPVPILYAFSRHVRPVPGDYPRHAHVTGYWFLDPPDGYAPSPALERFLAAGPPPVHIGFGSMGFGKGADDRFQTIIAAVRRLGARAIISTGWTTAATASGGDDILVIDEAPHRWLFPQVAAVVHHGGSGTTAAGLRAGRPTLVCPVLADQPFWGDQVRALGAGPQPLPWRRISVERMVSSLGALLDDHQYEAAAQQVAGRLAAEDGPGTATAVLEHLDDPARGQRRTPS